MRTSLRFLALMFALSWIGPGRLAAQPIPTAGAAPASAPASPQHDMNEAAFRAGLRQRGLEALLEQYLADTPPAGPVDEQLRRRERLLAEAQSPNVTRTRRRELVRAAGNILSTLIENHPEHPARLSWRLELARDRLEREDPAAFDAVILYELPGRDRAIAARLSSEAVAILETLRKEVAEAWKTFESLDEQQMARAAESGATRSLELIDGRSAFLLAWAQLYHAISADLPEAERTQRLTELLQTITERYGWIAPSPGREDQRASALAMFAVASRLTGKYLDAEFAAREIISSVTAVRRPGIRRELDRLVLPAVLEQIRASRDAGKLNDARAILNEARAWAERTRKGDLQTELALAFAERSVLARQATGQPAGGAAPAGSAPSEDVLTPAEALLPLQRVAGLSPTVRDALYAVLAGAIAEDRPLDELSPFTLQLLAGARIADRAAIVAPPDGGSTQTQPAGVRPSAGLTKLASALAAMIATPAAPLPGTIHGELMYLLARAHYLNGAPLEAVRVLGDLVERHPRHDRAEVAVRQATTIAQEVLRAGGADEPAARAAFVRAGRLLRKQLPDSDEARELQFFIAAALDHNGQYEEAAAEYTAVPADSPHALRAAWGRARCLRDALNAATATRPADDQSRELAKRALLAAREAARRAEATTVQDASTEAACLAADITLLLAGVLGHPSLGQYEEVVKVLDGFETRHAGCPRALAVALRERVAALRQLKRMDEARVAVEQYLATDPASAGPLMARLLDAMRDEIHAAADRGDAQAMKATAGEAAKLADRLLTWAGKHDDRLSPAERLTVSVWRAWALLESGQAAEALAAYDDAARAGPEVLPANSALFVEIRLGRAECLLAMGQPAEALPIFDETLKRVPEQSPYWWRAYVRALECHTRMAGGPEKAQEIVQSIRQQRRLFPELGGPRWARELQRIEGENEGK